jgi:leucine dehydrogenase
MTTGENVTVESLIREWDGETVIAHYDRATRAWIFIAIHSTCLGPATGGTRMKNYPDAPAALQDAFRLAAGMTFKYAAADFPRGGGKAVIALPPDFDPRNRPALLRQYGSLVHQLGGLFYTGPDVGTCSADMDVIAETGAPYVFARTPAAGGAGDSAPPTALGVFCGIQTTCEYLFGDASLRGRRVLVQGAGGVGGRLIERLRAADAQVLFSDVDESVIRYFRDEQGLPFVSPERCYDTPCDVFSPCALGGILNQDTIPRLHCRAIVGSANNQLAMPEDAERLRASGIVYAPDFVVNIGGALAITGIEVMGWSPSYAEEQVMRVHETLRKVFERAKAAGITTDTAARQMAEERLAAGR